MSMNRNEKKALYAFGCPNRKATVERLKLLAALAPEPTAKKLFRSLPSSCPVRMQTDGIAASSTICVWRLRVTSPTISVGSMSPMTGGTNDEADEV